MGKELPEMTNYYLNLMTLISQRRESGQGTIEYVGIAVVIGLMVVVLLGAASGWGSELSGQVSDLITNITERGSW